MAKVNIEDIRSTVLQAADRVDSLLKDQEPSFYYEIQSINFDMSLCDEDGEDEDESMIITVAFSWLNEMQHHGSESCKGATSAVSLSPCDIVSPDFVAGYLLAALDAREGLL